MAKENRFETIVSMFIRIKNKINSVDKKPRDYGTGDMLYCSEINTIEVIGNNKNIILTSLAKKMGITKGAVSQSVAKLVKKGFVSRFHDPGNDKEILLDLTKKGLVAFKGYKKYRNKMASEIQKDLNKLSNNEFVFLKDVFSKFEKFAEKMENNK